MEMMKQSCEQFLTELAGKAPTPGGGGTAALVGAAGVARSEEHTSELQSQR